MTPNNFFPPEISQQLEELGCASQSLYWWRNDYPDNPTKYKDEWYLVADYNYPLTGEHRAVKYRNGWHLLPAFNLLDCLNKENAILVFGEETEYEKHIRLGQCHGHQDVCGFTTQNQPQWQSSIHHLLDLYNSGGDWQNYVSNFLKK